jgi:pimeloyl-ACP methyl ester carboxylesterase
MFLALAIADPAAAQAIAPYKDDLFAYPALLSEGDGGAYRVVDYREARDIDKRDQVPERRVRSNYVSLGVRKVQEDLVLKSDAGDIRHFAIGQTEGAKLMVVYLHGQGGSRKQGADDFTFGGNFNRLKNLVAGYGGLYLVPDFPDFGDGGAQQVAALISHYAVRSPDAGVVIACGSMGGQLCWKLASDPAIAPRLSGLAILGSLWDEAFFASSAFKRKVPVYFGHGSHDTVFPVERQEAFFHAIKERAPGYPAQFVRFETGTHGTPIRMIDWRETLNWMLAASR